MHSFHARNIPLRTQPILARNVWCRLRFPSEAAGMRLTALTLNACERERRQVGGRLHALCLGQLLHCQLPEQLLSPHRHRSLLRVAVFRSRHTRGTNAEGDAPTCEQQNCWLRGVSRGSNLFGIRQFQKSKVCIARMMCRGLMDMQQSFFTRPPHQQNLANAPNRWANSL